MMKAKKFQKTICIISTIAAFGISSASNAQSQPDPIGLVPSDQQIVSSGGVNMKTGEYVYSSVDAQIGGEGEFGGISLVRSIRSGFQNDSGPSDGVLIPASTFNHNWNIRIAENLVRLRGYSTLAGEHTGYPDYNHSQNRNQPDYRFEINWSSRTETFDWLYSHGGLGQASAPETSISYLWRDASVERSGSAVYTYEATDGTKVIFRPMAYECGSTIKRCAYASQIISPDGTIFQLSYEPATPEFGIPSIRLSSVVSNKGYGLKLFYDNNNNKIRTACLVNLSHSSLPSSSNCDADGIQKVSYDYQGNYLDGISFTITKPGNIIEKMVYTRNSSDSPSIMEFYRNDDVSPYLTNTLLGRTTVVQRQDFSDGQFYEYSFNRIFFDTKFRYAGGTVTDALGGTKTFDFEQIERPEPTRPTPPTSGERGRCGRDCYSFPVFQVSAGPTSITDELGRTSVMDYCDPQISTLSGNDGGGCVYYLLQSITDPEGRKVEFTYNLNRQVVVERRTKAKPGSGNSDIIETAEYACNLSHCLTKPTKVIDANGNVTDYEYAIDHGGLTRFRGADVFGKRPEIRYNYGQRYAWFKNSNGTFVRANSPVWVLLNEQSCNNDNFNACDRENLVTTHYQYEEGSTSKGSNLLLKGIAVTVTNATGQSETLLTCYSYDSLGRQVSVTQPKGNAGVCL